MGSWSDPLVVFDAETTGKEPETARIVEVGTARFDGARIRPHRRLVNPGCPIPPDATAIHRIRDEDVAAAPPFGRIAGQLVDYLTGPRLAGYNAHAYDVVVINAELARCGHAGRLDPATVLDVIIFVRWHLRHIPKRHLQDICTLRDIPLTEAHSAAADAQATGLLLLNLVKAGLIPEDPDHALVEQAQTAARLKDEWDRWSYWLYRSRSAHDGRLTLGCGKHVNTPLCKVDPGYCRYLLARHRDPTSDMELPAEVVRLFELREAGVTDGEVVHA